MGKYITTGRGASLYNRGAGNSVLIVALDAGGLVSVEFIGNEEMAFSMYLNNLQVEFVNGTVTLRLGKKVYSTEEFNVWIDKAHLLKTFLGY